MIQFKPIDLTDALTLTPILEQLNCKLLNYSFSVLFLYQKSLDFSYAYRDDFLIIKARQNEIDFFMFPIGSGNVTEILEKIAIETLINQKEVRFCQFCENNAAKILDWANDFCSRNNFEMKFESHRNDYEYIYSAQKLAKLEGQLMKPKRNQINFFTKNFNWKSELISADNLTEVNQFNQLWEEENWTEDSGSSDKEKIAIEVAFANYQNLCLKGMVIKVEEKVVAFSIGFPLNSDTFLILFEKADRNYKGAYTMVNKLFAIEIAKKHTYINRAEDAGVEGLRKAKLSYFPEFLLEVNEVLIKKKTDS